MQEEASNKTFAVAFRTAQLSSQVILSVLQFAYKKWKEGHDNPRGKQSLKKLSKQNFKLASIDLNNSDLRAFQRAAKDCGLDFSVMKGPDQQYVVFFKARDADLMDLALKRLLYKKTHEREPLFKRLNRIKQDLGQAERQALANLILGCVFCYEIINAILDNNSLHDTDIVEVVYKSLIKLAIMIGIVTNVYQITMGIFEMGAWTVAQSAGVITGDATVDVGVSIEAIKTDLMELPPSFDSIAYLAKLCITSFIVSWAMKAISVVISVVVMGRMIEIYIYCEIRRPLLHQ